MTPRTLALASLLALAAAASGQTPPQDLHLVGDHWTAWDPPTSFPEGTQVYTIVPGDTLWDLAAKNLGDPYLWPQIWERNRYILDAHWIYPGDPLLLGLQVAEPETPTAAETTELTPTEPEGAPGEPGETGVTASKGAVEIGSPSYPFVQLGSADDIYCSGYIGDLREEFPYRLVGSEYEFLKPSFEHKGVRSPIQARFGAADTVKYGLYLGDIVYLDQGSSSGLQPGDLLSAVEPQHVVHHPSGGKPIGRYYAYEGRVLVLAVQENTAIGEIVQSCDPMVIGSTLKTFVAEPVPSERKEPMRPVTDPSSADAIAGGATIVFAKDRLVTLGQDHVVFIDRGEDQNLFPGDVLTVYRLPARNVPPIVLGEIAIMSVRPHTAVAKVITSRFPMYVGDLALAD
ncbi:MAG TPA: LysM domain-containing protein [Thermoanaerobaculia bacterium]|nr:LysM domain-containing protein [Thermoanaerobaculia bacterium]